MKRKQVYYSEVCYCEWYYYDGRIKEDRGRKSPDGYFSVVTRESRLQEKKRDWGEKVQTIGSSWTEQREKIQTEGDEEEVGGDLP